MIYKLLLLYVNIYIIKGKHFLMLHAILFWFLRLKTLRKYVFLSNLIYFAMKRILWQFLVIN